MGIAISDDYESALQIAENQNKQYLIGVDENGDMAVDFGVTGVPETFFINKKGKLIYKHTGPLATGEIKQLLAKLHNPLFLVRPRQILL